MLPSRLLASASLIGLLACSDPVAQRVPEGDDEALPDLDADLTGTFSGSFRSETQGIFLEAILTLHLSESGDGEVTGEFALSGVLLDDATVVPIGGTGPLVGFVSPEERASFQFVAAPEACPHQGVEFSGEFDRRVASLLLGGPIIILDACVVVLTFPSTISLGIQ